MKFPIVTTNDPAVERNVSRSDMDLVIALLDRIPELIEVPATLDAIQVLDASITTKATEVAANILIVQTETATAVSNAASALNSKNAAELSEINASNSANSATISKDNALASAVSANASAQSALTSKDSANLSAISASNSESVAITKANEANTSAISASISASNALVSETNASNSAGTSILKATEASNSALSAETSAESSSVNAANALASENKAYQWAEEAENVPVQGAIGIDAEYSAKHWAKKAESAIGGTLTLGGLYNVEDTDRVDGSIIRWDANLGKYVTYDFSHNDVIGFDTTANVIVNEGEIAWNSTEGTADLGLPNGVTLQLGQENNRLVRNNTGSTITNGTVVVATGSIGASGRITVAPCGGLTSDTHSIYGVTTQDILSGQDGYITIDGKVRMINTTGSSVGESWTDGEILYVKPNDNGRLTNVVPATGELKVSIAKVVRAHASTGILEVRTTSVLDENAYEPRNTNIQSHISNTSNPHGVTKLQIGLGNAEDTADNVKNVLSATKWTTARTINGVSVDGSSNVTIPVNTSQTSSNVNYNIPFVSSFGAGYQSLYTDSAANLTYNPSTNTLTTTTFNGALTGNATTASTLQTGRTIGMTGDVTWTSASFNGSADVTGTATLATITNSGTGEFKKVTTDTKGRVTGTQAVVQADITGLLGAGSITNTMLAESATQIMSDTSTTVGSVKYNGITPLAGAFSGGTTAPLVVGNRLNYSGYFHPTYINLGASNDTSVAATHYYVETANDGFVRPKALANVRAEIITKAALLSADPYYFNSGIGTSGIAALTNYPLFPAGQDTLTLAVGTYRVCLTVYCAVATSTVSSLMYLNMRGAGTATGTIYCVVSGTITNGGSPVQKVSGAPISSSISATSSSDVAGRVYTVYMEAVMNITVAGTIIPSYQWSAALTSGVVSLSLLNNIVIDKMAETSVTTTGGWA